MGVLIGPRKVLSHHDGRGDRSNMLTAVSVPLGLKHHTSWQPLSDKCRQRAGDGEPFDLSIDASRRETGNEL
jgi:hypothetical protein